MDYNIEEKIMNYTYLYDKGLSIEEIEFIIKVLKLYNEAESSK